MQPAPLRIAQRGMTFEYDPDGLHRCEASDHARHRTEHTVGSASIAIIAIEGVAHEAAVAWLVWQMPGEVRHLSLKASDSRARKWNSRFDAGVRNSEPSREVVTAVEYDVCAGNGIGGVVSRHSRDDHADLEVGIEAPDPSGCQFRLGQSDVLGGKDRLALQVADFDDVAVDQRELAYPGRCQILERGAAQPAAAHQRDVGLCERDLTGSADLGQNDVARETGETIG